jgi:RNA polymerase sigma factor (sigma-70 family)
MRNKRQEAERKQAFEALTAPHLGALYRFAVHKVQDANQAEDLVQETCLKAYRAFDRFARGSNYQAWLFRILLNTITDFQRKTAREAPDTGAICTSRRNAAINSIQSSKSSLAHWPQQCRRPSQGCHRTGSLWCC